MKLHREVRRRFVAMGGLGLCLCVLLTGAVQEASAARKPWTTSRLQGSPEPPEPYRIVPSFPELRFQKPTSLEEFPDQNRLLVTEMGGKIFSFPKEAATSQADLVLDLTARLPADLAGKNVSLFDAEFHPRFAENRFVFVCYVHPGDGGHTRVSRFKLNAESPPRAAADVEQVLITWPSGGHNAGCLEFGKDGYLYIATGDGSGPNPPDGRTTGQTVDDLLGAVLRIDVDHPSQERAYGVPQDNPFVALPNARPEIWAYGLRNPWKIGVDPQSGDVFAADNGWETWETIHRIVRGGNCGWPVMEGRAALRSEVAVGPTPIIPPIKDHSHTEANSVIGGPVYRGDKLPDLAGAFVYGDYITGTIWAVKPDGDSYSHTTLVDTDQRIVAFTQGSRGELYVVDYDFTGQIYEIVPSDVKDTSATFPRRLSETGLFSSLQKLEPAAGVVPYTVRAGRWLDGAEAERWVAIPGDGRIQPATSVDSGAVYPEGTVFVKHLRLPASEGRAAVQLETQLLHFERGVWRPYSYLWDEAGRDATLVESIGTGRPLKFAATPAEKENPADRTWHVNAVNECKLCHNAGPRFVLGFALNQLDFSPDGGSQATNQLRRLADEGVITATPSLDSNDPSRLVNPHDAAQSLDDRARSYLHANCSACHHPGGNAIVSFFLRRDLPFEKLNTNKGTGIGTFGMHDAKLIVPGDPYRSVLMYRMSKLGYARMPYIGSRVVDGDGVALIEQWIRSLPSDSTATRSAPLTSGSAAAAALQSLTSAASSSGKPTDAAIGELVKSTEGALALVLQMHRGALAGETFASAVTAGSAASSDVRGLFDTFVPESKRRATLGGIIDPQVVLSRQGDRERGKLIFFSDGARCRNCHELNDRQKSLGPTLLEITKKYPRPAELLQHALQPSLKIEEPFAAYTIVVDDGRVLNGLLVEQSETEVAVKTIERQVIRLARKNIEEMTKSAKSLMPERILSDLTAQEAADLFEFIRSQTAEPAPR
jgi:putative heme-binding domain-containing protein